MTKVQSVFSKIFCGVFALVFAWISWLCLTESQLMWLFKSRVLAVAVAECLICLGVFLLCQFLSKRIRNPKRLEAVILIAAFAVYIYLQVFFAGNFYFRRGTSWDFNVVAGAAMDYVKDGIPGGSYFRNWPNNIPLFLLLIAVFKPFSLLGADLNWVGIGLNMLAIDLSFLLGYLILKKVTGSRTAGFIGLGILFLTLPFLTYTAVYYTDTLTLPFPLLIFYLWLIGKDRLEEKGVSAALPYLMILAAAAAAGGTLKLSAAFMFIAIVIDALLHVPFRKFAAAVLPAVALFAVLYIGFGHVCNNSPALVEDREEYYIPKLHWVMMGLHGNGNYYDDDYQLTLSVPADQRDELCRTEIVRRVREYGVGGMLDHLHKKTAFVWAEGTYYSSLKIDLSRDRALTSTLDPYFIYTGAKFTYTAHYCQGLELVNLVLMAACALRMLFSKTKKEPLFACCVAVFGLFLFECIWEARSRYIFNYVPVFIVIAAVQLFDLFSLIRSRSTRSA